MGYIENATLGMGGIKLNGFGTTEKFVGANVTANTNTYANAKDAGGLDWGTDAGTFNMKLTFKVRCIEELAFESATGKETVKLTVYSSAKNGNDAGFSEVGSYTILADALNAVRLKNNINFSALPTIGRYFCIGIKCSAAPTAGTILVEAVPSGY